MTIQPQLLSPDELKAIVITRGIDLPLLRNQQSLPGMVNPFPDLFGNETIKKLLAHIAALEERNELRAVLTLIKTGYWGEEELDDYFRDINWYIKQGGKENLPPESVLESHKQWRTELMKCSDDEEPFPALIDRVHAAIGYQNPQEGCGVE